MPERIGGRGDGRREVAGGGAGKRGEAELGGTRRGHADDPVLERERRVARVVLDPEALQAEAARQPRGGRQRADRDAQALGRDAVEGEELGEAPEVGGASIEGLRGSDAGRELIKIVGRLERPEAPGTHEQRRPSRAACPQARQRSPA